MPQQYSIFKLQYKKEWKTDYVRKITMPPEKERKNPFECELCESSFASKHQLRKHVSTHGRLSFYTETLLYVFSPYDY